MNELENIIRGIVQDRDRLLLENRGLKNALDESHKACDGFSVRETKDSYPEQDPSQTLSLPERIQALCKAIADYQRWMEQAERLVGHPLPVTDEDEARLLGRGGQESPWIACSERMPTEEDGFKVIWRFRDGAIMAFMRGGQDISPVHLSSRTHWMPVPPLPEPEAVDPFEQFCHAMKLDTHRIQMEGQFYGLYCDPITREAKDAWDAALASVSQQQAHDLP